MTKREAVVAGQFYPSSPSELTRQVDGYMEDSSKESVLGFVSPHAGIMYSGKVAGAVFSRVLIPDTLLLIGPNHTGLGTPVSIMSTGDWVLPTGTLSIDAKTASALKARCDLFEEDSFAHRMEHSLEVQLPFALHVASDIKIVPVTMMSGPYETCLEVGRAMAQVIEETGKPVTMVASSDMSHYVDDATAREKDRMAIDRILALDPEGLYRTVMEEKISMCGVMPVTAMLCAALELGATGAELVKYMTSGETSGDYDHVVGYAGLIIK